MVLQVGLAVGLVNTGAQGHMGTLSCPGIWSVLGHAQQSLHSTDCTGSVSAPVITAVHFRTFEQVAAAVPAGLVASVIPAGSSRGQLYLSSPALPV